MMNCVAGEYLYADRKPHNINCLVLCQRQTKRFALKILLLFSFNTMMDLKFQWRKKQVLVCVQ